MTDSGDVIGSVRATSSGEVTIQRGLPESSRADAAWIFDEAFSEKLAMAIPSRERRLAFLQESLCSDHSVTALRGDELVGIAGLSSADGPYRGGLMSKIDDFGQMRSLLGFRGALRAGLVLAVGEHRPSADELYLDGIAVAAPARSHGIGSLLLDEVARIGREGDYRRVFLQVVDINPRAQQLYMRRGYRVTDVQSFGFMRRFVGFGGVASMELQLDASEIGPD